MKKATVIMHCFILTLAIGLTTSCSSDSEELIGVEVSGSSFDGTYLLELNYTKSKKFVNKSDESERIIEYSNDDDKAMWGLMKGNTLYYKIEQNGSTPPKSQWDCGVGVHKDKFRVMPIY